MAKGIKARSDLFLEALKGSGKQKELAANLGIQQGAIAAQMKKGAEVSYQTLAKWCKNYHHHSCIVRPLLEMWEIPEKLSDLSEENRGLMKKTGIYALFDSLGRIIYVGKTEKRDFGFELFYVRLNCKIKGDFTISKSNGKAETAKSVRKNKMTFRNVAKYFSTYEVDKGHIGDIEALLTHLLVNTTLNAKQERFKVHRKLNAPVFLDSRKIRF